MKEITFEMAEDLGLIPSALPYAFKAVRGCSILSPGTDKAFESAYRDKAREIRKKYQTVSFRGEKLKVI